MPIPLRILTYVSRATRVPTEDELVLLGIEAARLNALDGVTGLLVFNGTNFSQTIEGGENAIGDLLDRLRRDPRHTELNVVSDEIVESRRFASWNMRVLNLPPGREDADGRCEVLLSAQSDPLSRRTIRATVDACFA